MLPQPPALSVAPAIVAAALRSRGNALVRLRGQLIASKDVHADPTFHRTLLELAARDLQLARLPADALSPAVWLLAVDHALESLPLEPPQPGRPSIVNLDAAMAMPALSPRLNADPVEEVR